MPEALISSTKFLASRIAISLTAVASFLHSVTLSENSMMEKKSEKKGKKILNWDIVRSNTTSCSVLVL